MITSTPGICTRWNGYKKLKTQEKSNDVNNSRPGSNLGGFSRSVGTYPNDADLPDFVSGKAPRCNRPGPLQQPIQATAHPVKNIFQNPLTFAEQNAIIKRGIMYYFQKEERKSIFYI